MSYSSTTHPLQTYVHNGGQSNLRKFEYNKKLTDYFPSTIYYPEKLYKKIPKEFQPYKTIWKDLILPPTDQGSCGSCWAYAATNTLSDRYNIWAGKKITNGLSPFLILNCNLFATFFKNEKIVNEIDYETWNKETGCYGNILIASILYIYFFGIPSLDCYPYDIDNLNEFKAQSTNFSFYNPSNSNINLKDSTFNLTNFNSNQVSPSCAFATQGQPPPFRFCQNLIDVNKYKVYSSSVQSFSITHFYSIENIEEQIQLEILYNGPVLSAFLIYDDFYSFNPKESIYIHNSNDFLNPTGGHAIEIVGWGEENEIKYWWIKNTWGEKYGIGGYFRILRGKNMCHIEQNVHGFFPDLYIDYQNYEKIQKYMYQIEKYKFLKSIQSDKLEDLVQKVLDYIKNTEHKGKKVTGNYFIKEYFKKYNSFAYSIMVRSSLLFFYYSNNYISTLTGNTIPLETGVVNEELSTIGYRKNLSLVKNYSPNYNIIFIFIFILILFSLILYMN